MGGGLCVLRPHLSPSLKAHGVLLLSRVCLCCFPPPLGPVITALDSSSDGKCFSIPRSPSTPPHHTHTHPPHTSPSFSFSHQANYISVTIVTCLLNALSYPPLGFFFFCPLPVLSFHLFTLSFHSGELLVIHLFPPFRCCYCLPSRGSIFRGLMVRFCSRKDEE